MHPAGLSREGREPHSGRRGDGHSVWPGSEAVQHMSKLRTQSPGPGDRTQAPPGGRSSPSSQVSRGLIMCGDSECSWNPAKNRGAEEAGHGPRATTQDLNHHGLASETALFLFPKLSQLWGPGHGSDGPLGPFARQCGPRGPSTKGRESSKQRAAPLIPPPPGVGVEGGFSCFPPSSGGPGWGTRGSR